LHPGTSPLAFEGPSPRAVDRRRAYEAELAAREADWRDQELPADERTRRRRQLKYDMLNRDLIRETAAERGDSLEEALP